MKKFISFFLFLYLGFFSLDASAQVSIFKKIKDVNVQEFLANNPLMVNRNVRPYARMRSVTHTATERVRIPDLSTSNAPKYYYIRNVMTGEYLHYEGNGVPLKTVQVPDEASKFYMVKHGLNMSSGGGSLHNYCTIGKNGEEDKILQSISTNSWVEVTNRHQSPIDPIISFYPTEDGSGCYIVDEFIDEKTQSWRYDEEKGIVVVGERDEYAVWIAEALPEQPEVSVEEADATWYVVKNVNTGKYLHYEGANSAMSLVTSPDPCSLFFAFATDGGVEIHNHAAGELVYSNVGQWSTEATPMQFVPNETLNQFFISVSGDKEANDIWYHDENTGTLAIGAFGDNSLWEFERISDFKEIFGLCYNGEVYGAAANKLLECLHLENTGVVQMYAEVVATILSMMAMGSNDNFKTPESTLEFKATLDELDASIKAEYPADAYDDVKVYNVSYTDVETGETLMKSLSTNSSLPIFNDNAYSHTNVWQMKGRFKKTNVDNIEELFGETLDIGYSVSFYNVVTGMYVTAPRDECGELIVGMTSNAEEAGNWNVTPGLNSDNSGVFYVQTRIESAEMPGYYLQLASPDDITVSCIEVTEDAVDVPGLEWMITLSDAVIDKGVYGHAAETAVLYPQLLQDVAGCVKVDAYYSSNYPSGDAGSSLGNLLDFNTNTSFWTDDENDNGEKHYLQADLGSGKELSEFYFYLRSSSLSCYGVPVSIKVEGSNSANDGFVTLAEVEMPTLLYDMCYFSNLVQSSESYRYLRFTIDEVNTGEDERIFALSEFYIYPNIPEVAMASELLSTFYGSDFMGADIVAPSTGLIKKEAEYYLDMYKDNHAELPSVGQCPTSKYNALLEAYNATNPDDAESLVALAVALDELVEAKLSFICIIESAWENGYSNGIAMGLDSELTDIVAQEFNAWDMRQWVILDRKGDETNPYSLEFVGARGNINKVSLDEIEGWNELYESGRNAYNLSVKSSTTDYAAYFSVERELDGKKYFDAITSPATTEQNQKAAWYLTIVSNSDKVARINDKNFIESLAEFGKVFAKAKYYQEGVNNGQFTYQERNGLTKAGFDEIYYMFANYYDLGPIALADMFVAGEIPYEALDVLNQGLQALRYHFPNFVDDNDIAGYYFRLRGKASGKYFSDDNGQFAMLGVESENAEVQSVFYTVDKGNDASVMSFASGRYVKAEADGSIKYDEIPQDGVDHITQIAHLYNSLSGANNCYSVAFEEGLYLTDMTTSVGVTSGGVADASCDWEVEIVEELPIVVSAAKYATLYVPVELRIPAGVKAYVLYDESVTQSGSDIDPATGSAYEKGQQVLRLKEVQGGVLPAGLPVILRANAGTYYFPINYVPTLTTEEEKCATYSSDDEPIVNLLEGRHATTYIPESDECIHYILANKSLGVGMYKVLMDDATIDGVNYFQNNAHRAWLPIPMAMTSGANGYRFSVANEGVSTSLDDMMNDAEEIVIFDLQGRRVTEMTKGVYIVNGKKVVK